MTFKIGNCVETTQTVRILHRLTGEWLRVLACERGVVVTPERERTLVRFGERRQYWIANDVLRCVKGDGQ